MKENKISKAIIYFIGIAVALISLFPLIWMAVAGLKPEAEVLAVPFKFFPSRIDTQNYKVIIEEGLFLRSLGVTFLVAVISAVLALAINSMSAYVFARLEFPFKKLLWAYEIMTMFIPNIAILISSFIVVSKLGMLDTMAVLILPGLATAYSVFFIRQFYLNIPSSIEEALERIAKFTDKLDIGLRLNGIFGPHQIIIYRLDSGSSLLNYALKNGPSRRLTPEESKILSWSTSPKVNISSETLSGSLYLSVSLKGLEAQCIMITPNQE
jgi:hypothetical protein